VRFFQEKNGKSRIALELAGKAQSQPLATTETHEGWSSLVIRDVAIRDGDEIAVTTSGDPLKLDYLQLNAR